MIAALLTADSASASGGAAGWQVAEPITAAAAPSAERRPGPVTEFFGDRVEVQPRGNYAARCCCPSRRWKTPCRRNSTRWSCRPRSSTPQPTLIVGVGGAAGEVLKQLRLRMSKQFGDEPLPAVQMLLLDSDPKAIAQAMAGRRTQRRSSPRKR